MELKLIFSFVSTCILLFAYVPYLRSILNEETKPHIYSWLVWVITVGTNALVVYSHDGGYGSLVLLMVTGLQFMVFLLAVKFGTKNITSFDTVVLLLTLLAIFIWWQMDNVLLAVLLLSLIDALGYMPTYRKIWHAPDSESMLFWILMLCAGALTLAALETYSLITMVYIATIFMANCIVVGILFLRKRMK